jgi:alkylation response protein AidB-like acyl-CoA dehydrogenase
LDFSLTDEQLMLQRLLERFAENRYGSGPRSASRSALREVELRHWQELADLGVLAAPFHVAHGGLGDDPETTLVVMEAIGRALMAEPVLERVILPGRLLQRAPAQCGRWLPQLLDGTTQFALAHVEPATGFRLDQAFTVARETPLGVVLDGEKSWVPAGAGADLFIVSARTSPANTAPLRCYLVRADAEGVSARPYRTVDGAMACALHLQQAPAIDVLDCDVGAFEQAMDDARLAAGAEMLGVMGALLEMTLEHVRTRKQFGAPLGSFQVVQHRLADLYVRLEQSRSQLYRAALTHGPARVAAIAGMKSYISAAAIEMGEDCVHLHGGMGMADEMPVGVGYKRLLLLATLLGDADHELQRFASHAAAVTPRAAS